MLQGSKAPFLDMVDGMVGDALQHLAQNTALKGHSVGRADQAKDGGGRSPPASDPVCEACPCWSHRR